MSIFGKKPVLVPASVKVSLKDGEIFVEGPKGKMQLSLPAGVTCEQKDGSLVFAIAKDTKPLRSLQGTMRSLTVNMIAGVNVGFSKTLLIEGVGYKAAVQGKNLRLNVGFSHPVDFPVPEGIKIDAAKQVEIVISGVDKAKVGKAAAEIRDVCPPEPYKGKGIRYSDERIRRKVGKAVTK